MIHRLDQVNVGRPELRQFYSPCSLARELLGQKIKQPKGLVEHKARAKSKKFHGIRWGQMPAHNGLTPQNYQLPPFVQQVGAGEDERSVLVVDSRDQRIQTLSRMAA